MGQVYLARSTGLGGFERQVVVKTLDLSITDDDDAFVTMFLDEARLVGALHHQYIAPVYEVGCDDERRYYLVMDYVHGETAEAVYRTSKDRGVPVPLPFALTVVSCVASALDYAHNLCAADGSPLDIVHRDISLSNVMVGYDGAVKLIDFGIAKAANRATKTQVGTLKGKIGYLAPEQILRKQVDHRADIFALGIVLYELTTATRAFRESSDLVTLERITDGLVRPPSEVVKDYPPELERIVLKALQVDPDQRFQDVATMGRELEALAAQLRLPLGHAAVIHLMTELFGDQRRSRRRIARGSHDVKTDPRLAAVEQDDEKTPVVDVAIVEETARHDAARARSQRPTAPMRDAMSEAAGHHAVLALDDLSGPIADAGSGAQLVERPTPPHRSSAARIRMPAVRPPTPPRPLAPHPRMPEHTPTGPQPIGAVVRPPSLVAAPYHDDLEDAPTHIAGFRPEREDPTDISATVTVPPLAVARMPLGTAQVVRTRSLPGSITNAVVSRVKPAISQATLRWLLLCAVFAIAVVAAILLAIL
jgi:serine/threonine-protein kinase